MAFHASITFFQGSVQLKSISPPWWKISEIRESIDMKRDYINNDWVEHSSITLEQFVDLHLDQMKHNDTPVFQSAAWQRQVNGTLAEIDQLIQNPPPFTLIEVRIIDLS